MLLSVLFGTSSGVGSKTTLSRVMILTPMVSSSVYQHGIISDDDFYNSNDSDGNSIAIVMLI